jgi:transcriptional regulator with XRE-family HTH domain
MERPVNERLKAVRNALQLSQRDFSKGIFLEQSSLARIEQGKITVNDRIIELVCSKYNVNKAYLKNNKGKMFVDGNFPDVKLEQLNRIFNELNATFQDCLINQAKELLKLQQKQND